MKGIFVMSSLTSALSVFSASGPIHSLEHYEYKSIIKHHFYTINVWIFNWFINVQIFIDLFIEMSIDYSIEIISVEKRTLDCD